MRVFKENELKEFSYILKQNQSDLKETCVKFLKKAKYKKIINKPEYIVAEGKIPIALVAHLDTVFKDPPTDIYYDTVKNVMWSPDGLGADDRAGVYAIIKILLSGLRPHIIFTTDEEMGGIGADALAKAGNPFKDLRYIIELDRRGNDDCVFYECDNQEFTKYVEGFGFVENWGTYSDISELCPEWKVAGVNLSIGYKNEHSFTETLSVGSFFSTIKKVETMLKEKNIPYFKYVPALNTFYGKYTNNFWKPTKKNSGESIKSRCSVCGKYFDEVDVFPTLMKDGSIQNFCSDCAVDKVQWCVYCGEAFEGEENEYLCSVCKEDLLGDESRHFRY